MAMTSGQLRMGRCYVTAQREVRKIVEFEGTWARYVVRRDGVFHAWNKRWWVSVTREAFAREVTAEVGCE